MIAEGVGKVPRSYVPATLKALDRLLNEAIGIGEALLGQQRARIDARTASYKLVEAAAGSEAAKALAGDPETILAVMQSLLHKSYRVQKNHAAVASSMVADLVAHAADEPGANPRLADTTLEDDWLNVFERYAGDASSERMQSLWGRVISGEVRKPGTFSLRALRFLSEFSNEDAVQFSKVAAICFEGFVPRSLAIPTPTTDMTPFMNLESAGLLQGTTGYGVTNAVDVDAQGRGELAEGNIVIQLVGLPGKQITTSGIALTPLGNELLSLIPGRDKIAAAREVALAMKAPDILAAKLIDRRPDGDQILEVLWAKPDMPSSVG